MNEELASQEEAQNMELNSLETQRLAQASRKKTVLAARLAYLCLGILLAIWASLVPYAKIRLGVDESIFGILLFFIGLGGFVAMPFAGALTSRFGCRGMLSFALPVMFLVATMLAVVDSVIAMAIALMLFGGLMGFAEVGIKVQCALVERAVGRQMMSSFHAMYSLGGITGAACMAALLGIMDSPYWSTSIMAALAFIVIFTFCYRHFLPFADFVDTEMPAERTAENSDAQETQSIDKKSHKSLKAKKKIFTMPTGIVFAMGCVCFMIYTCEGVILDWAALFLHTERGIAAAQCGFAYAAFASTMTLGRLCGDRLALRFGSERLMFTSALVAVAGLLLAVFCTQIWQIFMGIALIGAGYANLSPLLFSLAARKTTICISETVAGIATLGYLGLLVGPAVMGIVAHVFNLSAVFMLESVVMVVVAVCAVRLHRM